MLSQISTTLEKRTKGNLDKEILRAGIIAELYAINLYEQMAAMTENENSKKTLLDITHGGGFQALLLREDREQREELEDEKEEVEERAGKE